MRMTQKSMAILGIAIAFVLAVGLVAGCSGEAETSSTVETDAGVTTTAVAAATTSTTSDGADYSHPAADVAAGPLSQQEEAALIYLREEEKLAHDVYLTLYEKWGTRVFSNISASETKHMASMKSLLDNYGLADPISTDEIGVFTDQELQRLFDTLVAQGSVSEAEALKVGVIIETKDIEDLESLVALTSHSDVKEVAENLLRGSQNHLRAFSRDR
jgi:hypothetical protein